RPPRGRRRLPPSSSERSPEMKAPRALVLVAVLAVLAVLPALAAGPALPPAPARFVTDNAGVLPSSAVAELEAKLQRIEDETSNQLLVYTEKRIPDGTTLEEYTVNTAQSWRAGQKEKKNGLVFFVFPESRAARFEVGYGLEGAFPDALASRVLRDEVVPRFA